MSWEDRFVIDHLLHPKSRTHLLPDPTSLETDHLATRITIALDENSKGCLVRQEGLGGIEVQEGGDGTKVQSGVEVLDEAWRLTEERSTELRRILKEST